MAVLTATKRRALPKREFAGKDRSFPIPDKVHAREAISGATRSEHAGNISPATEARIKAKARKKLSGADKATADQLTKRVAARND